jgi:[ribosomal protein S5]-alanine N-acetyltransferase
MNDENDHARALVLSLGGQRTRRQEFPDGRERDVFLIPRTAA